MRIIDDAVRSNCDGKTGAAHSTNGHPQWVMDESKPSTTRMYDLDNDGRCSGDVDMPAGYWPTANYDLVPPSGNTMRKCWGLFGNGDWHLVDRSGGLVGCAQPQPAYTYTWSDWTAVGRGVCGGEDQRVRVEQCADTSPLQDCPCQGRRDPGTNKETRKQPACTTQRTTTTSTTTTTTTTTATTVGNAPTTSTTTTSSSSVTLITTARRSTAVVPFPSTPSVAAPLNSTPSGGNASPPHDDVPTSESAGADSHQALAAGTVAVIVMGTLTLVGLAVAGIVVSMGKKSADAEEPDPHANEHAVVNAAYYTQPNPDQPAVYADAAAAAAAEASACAAAARNKQPGLPIDGSGYVIDGYLPRRGTVTAKAGSGVTYAIPVQEGERVSLVSNAVYDPAAPLDPMVRSNKKHQASVYDGFGPSAEEEEC